MGCHKSSLSGWDAAAHALTPKRLVALHCLFSIQIHCWLHDIYLRTWGPPLDPLLFTSQCAVSPGALPAGHGLPTYLVWPDMATNRAPGETLPSYKKGQATRNILGR